MRIELNKTTLKVDGEIITDTLSPTQKVTFFFEEDAKRTYTADCIVFFEKAAGFEIYGE